MNIRNKNLNIYLFDVDDQMRDEKPVQLGISCTDENVYITISERTETYDTVTYKMTHQLAFDLQTFISALQTATASSNYDVFIDVAEKQQADSKLPPEYIEQLMLMAASEKNISEDADLFEDK